MQLRKRLVKNNIEIVVSESGWPSEGGFGGSMDIAGSYYGNLVGH